MACGRSYFFLKNAISTAQHLPGALVYLNERVSYDYGNRKMVQCPEGLWLYRA